MCYTSSRVDYDEEIAAALADLPMTFPPVDAESVLAHGAVELEAAAANDDEPAAAVRKKGDRPASRLCPIADTHFLSEFKALKGITAGLSPVRIGVSPSVGISKGDHSSSLNTPLIDFTTKKPAQWRYLSDEVQAFFAHQALAARGPVIAFTAWCSAEISAKAYAAGKPLPWLRKRIDEALKAALGPVEFVFAIEEEFNTSTRTYRLHLHGELGLDGSKRRRLVKARAALRRALGAWQGEALKRQIRFKHGPDCGWISYATKRTWLATPRMRAFMAKHQAGRGWRLGFDGPALTMTNGIRELARRMHEEARQIVLEARRAAYESRQRPIAVEVPQPPVPAAAAPASDSQNAPAPASRLHDDLAAVVRMPLPVPVIVIRVAPIALVAAWTTWTRKPIARSSAPWTVRRLLAVQAAPIAAGDQFRLPAVACSRGPPATATSEAPGAAEKHLPTSRRLQILPPALPWSRGPPHVGSSSGTSSTRTR